MRIRRRQLKSRERERKGAKGDQNKIRTMANK